MNEHSPTPWIIEEARRSDHDWKVSASDGELLAWFSFHDPYGEANAHLLAAAPDLLAACELVATDEERAVQLADQMRRYPGEPALGLILTVYPELAIARTKARGQA